jgi:hypothetical protein
VLCAENTAFTLRQIKNAVRQAIDLLAREARQNPLAIRASSEMGSGSTDEIR